METREKTFPSMPNSSFVQECLTAVLAVKRKLLLPLLARSYFTSWDFPTSTDGQTGMRYKHRFLELKSALMLLLAGLQCDDSIESSSSISLLGHEIELNYVEQGCKLNRRTRTVLFISSAAPRMIASIKICKSSNFGHDAAIQGLNIPFLILAF